MILALLESFGGEMNKISFQKLLFLFAQQQQIPAFDFVPYKQGCFSFQSYADMRTMLKYAQVSEEKEKWIKTDETSYIGQLKPGDQAVLTQISQSYRNSTANDLISLTYKNYPYYALKSIIAHKFLSSEEMSMVAKTVRANTKTILYTIGYEGVSLETYLNKLILNDVKVLCDVRKNPLSMKYGFSKTQLKNACEGLGIVYVHIPDLGIDSDKRQSLVTQNDYNRLFVQYERTTLKTNHDAVGEVFDLLLKHKRIALTCFEADQCQCHRGTLAKAISGLPEWKYELKHL
ncbi:MAG TPA: DUF488 domain-containing protein [Bacteroidia bacterium]|nr:DUF488 domain-containing protein [Bacteroidia bacterium]